MDTIPPHGMSRPLKLSTRPAIAQIDDLVPAGDRDDVPVHYRSRGVQRVSPVTRRHDGGRWVRRHRRGALFCAAVAIASGALVPAAVARLAASTGARPAGASSAAMSALERVSRYLGPTAAATAVAVTVGLRERDSAGLALAIRSGATVSAAEFARRWGPEPAAVSALEAAARARGLEATWSAGSPLLDLSGPAAAIDAALGIHLVDWQAPDGTGYHDADRPVGPAPWMTAVATTVAGVETYSRPRPLADVGRDEQGFTPDQVRSFYNARTLLTQGFDGSGETIILPGFQVADSDLKLFTDTFQLSPITYTAVGTLPVSGKEEEETVLDLEAAHAMAPGARLLVVPGPDLNNGIGRGFIDANNAMVAVGVQGAIVDESYGWCGAEFEPGSAQQLDAVLQKGRALGMTFFVSTGDEGAYGCYRADNGQQTRITTELPAGDPAVTAVGGTTIVPGPGGAYGEEAAWSNPIGGGGGGGGLSADFPRPDWQTGPGTTTPDSNGKRQIPDVAAIADSDTGFAVADKGKIIAVGGTSLAAPVWAGFTALINEYLVRQHLRRIGFANPALYYFGQNAATLPGPPLHDVTAGNNLHYTATPGWDFTTGWGSPNVGALAAAWAAYITAGGA